MGQKRIAPSHSKTHVIRLTLVSLASFLAFSLCVTLAFWNHTTNKKEPKVLSSDVNVSQPFYSPPLSPQALKQISPTLPSLNSIIQGNMLPFEPEPSGPVALYETNKTDIFIDKPHKIAIVIDDMGVNTLETERVIDLLPTTITLSFLPYGSGTASQAESARKKGHEILVHIPMEALKNAEGISPNPGQNALYAADETDTLYQKTVKNIAPLLHIAVGANNHMGSKMTGDRRSMRPVLRALYDHNMFFLDSVTTGRSQVRQAAEKLPIPLLSRDVFLDHYQDTQSIEDALNQTLQKAVKTGSAIAIGHPYPETTEAIARWIHTLPDTVQLVPITALLKEGS